VALVLPAAAAAQTAVRAGGEPVACTDDAEPIGSLGITGIACDRCQFFTNGKVHRAVFWTEPTILELDEANPAAAVLREGDVLVAVDGQLITTSGGSERFSALPPDRPVRLRIRRDGRMVELSVPVAAACPTAKSAEAPVVAGRPVPMPPLPPGRDVWTAPLPREPRPPRAEAAVRVPELPAVPGVPGVPGLPEVPGVPVPGAGIGPSATLGFGFRCSHCGFGTAEIGPGRWSFSEPPEVVGVDEGEGPVALRAGDRLLELDGVDLTTGEGGRRFAAIRPGQSLTWTVERDGRRVEVTTRARERAPERAAPTAVAAGPGVAVGGRAPLRFSGSVGNTTVEVRGGRVNVTEDEGGRLLVIRTADTEIRIRVPGGDGH
jgi:hypothetical protein